MITNLITSEPHRLLIESVRGVKTPFLIGKGQQTTVNRNGRIYPAEMWDAMHEDATFQDRLQRKLILGCIGHPPDGVYDEEKTATALCEQYRDGENIFIRREILPTPSGNLLNTLYDCGVQFGVSSRGDGPYQESSNGNVIIQPGFILQGYDDVREESVHGAIPQHMMEDVGRHYGSIMESLNVFRKSTFIMEGLLPNIKPDNKPPMSTRPKKATRTHQESASTLRAKNKALRKRLEATEQRLKAAKTLLHESRAANKTLKGAHIRTRKDLNSATHIIAEGLQRRDERRKSMVESARKRALARFPSGSRAKVLTLLSEAKTVKRVKQVTESLLALSETSNKKSYGLPRSRSLTEGRRSARRAEVSESKTPAITEGKDARMDPTTLLMLNKLGVK